MRSASTPRKKPRTMWLAVTAAKKAVFLRNTKTNTPLPIWGTTGGENHQFFLCKLPIDKLASMWYNSSGDQRALDGRQGPIFRSHTPYAKFQILLATFHMRPIFPETTSASANNASFFLSALLSNFKGSAAAEGSVALPWSKANAMMLCRAL